MCGRRVGAVATSGVGNEGKEDLERVTERSSGCEDVRVTELIEHSLMR